MFQDDQPGGAASVPSFSGYGLGGVKGLRALPERICNLVILHLPRNYFDIYLKFRDKQRKGKRKAESQKDDEDEVTEPPKKGGKTKLVYGVSQQKFYGHDSNKVTVENLKLAAKMEKFEEIEEIFHQNRPALMKLIRFPSEIS